MANRFVQQHAGPAGAEQDGHFPSRGGHAFQIDQRLSQGRVDRAVPGIGLEQVIIEPPSPHAERAGFAPPVLLGDDGHVEAHERADIPGDKAIGADDFDHRPAGGQAGRYLHHARIAGAGGGVDHLQQLDLFGKGHGIERRGVGIEVAVVAARRRRGLPLGRIEQLQGLSGAADRLFADLVGMGKAGHLTRNAAQAESGIARVIGGFQAAIVKSESLAGDELHVQLAIVAARQGLGGQRLGAGRIELAIKQRTGIGRGHAPRYRTFRCWRQRRCREACPDRLRQPDRP